MLGLDAWQKWTPGALHYRRAITLAGTPVVMRAVHYEIIPADGSVYRWVIAGSKADPRPRLQQLVDCTVCSTSCLHR